MRDLAVIIPSRGRPDNIRRVIQAWRDTQASTAVMWIGIDDDDDIEAYQEVVAGAEGDFEVCLNVGVHSDMATTLNTLAVVAAGQFHIVGFCGDDHLPRTSNWNASVVWQLSGRPGIAYGNDLMQGPNLPTAVFMSSEIINTLGYMVPPGFRHLYLDNTWKDWGQSIPTRFIYLPDVIIEHMHPQAAGKGEWDEGYARVNGDEMWTHDADAYAHYVDTALDGDLEKIKALL